ncbi:MAG TPA: VIT1/CCC1 transporter family protein [Steroidobacteraceae bacterium]|nr:VIT1/CCC1 transporter family protein [Steroidobacteraceae bacterium]
MPEMSLARRLSNSLKASAGTVVFGMEDGTVSIFGLVLGVAATTTHSLEVLVAGASGAAAAAVSMMAGAYLEAETSRDERAASQERLAAELAGSGSSAALLTERLSAAGLKAPLCGALSRAVQHNTDAMKALLLALEGAPAGTRAPLQPALWMLGADFFSAAVPIVPFMLLPIATARVVASVITVALLVLLGVGRARIGNRGIARTVLETVGMGIAAALAGVAIGLAIQRGFA